MVKSRKIGPKFNRCVKSVRSTVKARKGSNKESAAIAICTKSVLQKRGRTLKSYRKGRLVTQRKLRGGAGFVEAAKAKAAALKARAVDKLGDVREGVVGKLGKLNKWSYDQTAEQYSEELIEDLKEYFNGDEFQKLKNTSPAPETLVKLNFNKSMYYSPQSWNLMIDKLQEFLSNSSSLPLPELKEVQPSLENLRNSAGTRDLPYFDVSNVEMAISKLVAARKAQQQKEYEERREAEKNASSSSSSSSGKVYEGATAARDLAGFGFF
jgi:hypothetical protein